MYERNETLIYKLGSHTVTVNVLRFVLLTTCTYALLDVVFSISVVSVERLRVIRCKKLTSYSTLKN